MKSLNPPPQCEDRHPPSRHCPHSSAYHPSACLQAYHQAYHPQEHYQPSSRRSATPSASARTPPSPRSGGRPATTTPRRSSTRSPSCPPPPAGSQLAAHRLVTQRVAHSERVVLQTVLRLDARLVRLVLRLELLRLLHHLLDLVRRQTTLLVLPPLVLLARRLLHRKHVQNAIRVNVERHLDLRLPQGIGGMPSRWNLPSRLLSLVIDRSPSYT
ncbi:hypothetical protein WA577_001863 [Blastocystis sp. JDR]